VEETAARFAQAIREQQPRGPYALGGHCYGGIVAFEVARQMSAQGERVSLLTLFDTPTPGYPMVMRHLGRYSRRALRLIREKRISVRQLMSQAPALARLAVRGVSARFERAAAKARAKTRPHSQPLDGGMANELAGRIYTPRSFSGKAVAFLAADEQVAARVLDDSRLGWRDFALGGLDVRAVAGLHDSMFAAPHVRELAEQLRGLLDPLNTRTEPGTEPRTEPRAAAAAFSGSG
jgi:thioesterase domain-containing protein